MNRPWSDIDLALTPQLPAMLGAEEQQFLHWLGQQNRGGAIVDLGAFLGASAACMSAGASSVNGSDPLYSYDLFTYGPWCEPFGMGDGWTDGEDTAKFVRGLLWPWRERIRLVKGDIVAQTWEHGGIDALFVDFTQNWTHHNHVCRAFLPHLRLGGILAHQDYVYVLCYWLHVFMERYADHFENLSLWIRNSTAAWRYTEPLPQEATTRGLNELLTWNEMLELIERSAECYQGAARCMIELARVRFFLHSKGIDAATQEWTAVERQFGASEQQHLIEDTRAEIARWPRDGGPYAGFFRT